MYSGIYIGLDERLQQSVQIHTLSPISLYFLTKMAR